MSPPFRRASIAVRAVAMALTFGAGLLLPPPRPAAAHAIVLESFPARDAVLPRAPERVILRFNSKIERRLSRVTLTTGGGPAVLVSSGDGDGAQEPDRLVIPLRPLAPGSYVVRYKVLSADGHITEGALRFTITGSDTH